MAQGATKETALWVIRKLRQAGFEALLAGGCVRDMLLGVRPTDYDVATNATPQQVRRLFGRVLMVGAQFGVAMVLHHKQTVEVATFRDDLSYTDGRRPDHVRFSSPREDALRRDFTINGMFFDPIADEVIDFVGGRADLEARVVRAIGDPDKRLAEDYLRLLRAVRFAARLEFALESATARAVARHADNLRKISGERIREELEKMLAGPHGEAAMAMAHELGLIEPIFGPAATEPAAWTAIADRLARLADRRDALLSIACVLASAADGNRPASAVRRIARRWGASNAWTAALTGLVSRLDLWRTAAELPLCEFKRLMALEIWPRLQLLWRAEEQRLTGSDTLSRRIARRAGTIAPEAVAPAPLLTGEDLKTLGLTEGRRLGRILKAIYDLQLNEIVLTRPQALDEARRMIASD